MKYKTVSVIIPVYNAEQYLDRCLKSVVEQTYTRLEIFLINDGSVDKSAQICDEWAFRDKRIKVVHQENKGVSAARNLGLKMCSGELCTFVDSDDYLHQDFIRYLVESMDGAQLGMVRTLYCPIDVQTKFKPLPKVCPVYYKIDRDFDISKVGYSNACWGILYDVDTIKKNSITFNVNYHYGEDALFFYFVLKKCKSMIYLRLPLYVHTINPEGACAKGWSEKHYSGLLSMEEKVQSIKEFPKVYLYEKVHSIGVYLSELIKLMESDGDQDKANYLKHKSEDGVFSLLIQVLLAEFSIESKLRLIKIICSFSKRLQVGKLWKDYKKFN